MASASIISTTWFGRAVPVSYTHLDVYKRQVFTYSMTAFVPKDIVLTILAVIFGIQLRKTLKRAGITLSLIHI